MKKMMRERLRSFFGGQATNMDSEILQALNQSDVLTSKIVRHYFTGGSYKTAGFVFFVSKSTYYRKIKEFIQKLGKCWENF